MKLEGIHHITAITADAQQNVDFYAGVLGLRLVKKSVNQDHTSSTTCSTPTRPATPARTSRSSSTRAPRGPRRRRHGPPDRLARRGPGGARLLGRPPRTRAPTRPATRTASCSTTPKDSPMSSGRPTRPTSR